MLDDRSLVSSLLSSGDPRHNDGEQILAHTGRALMGSDRQSEHYTNFNDVLSQYSTESHSGSPKSGDNGGGGGENTDRTKTARGAVCPPGAARNVVIVLSTLTLTSIPVITLLIVRHQHSTGALDTALYSSAIFVILTVPVSLHEIVMHWTHWYMPDVQKFVVRILFMVPIYSIQSWLSLRFHGKSIVIDTVRGFYEAVVISSFVYYLVALLGGEENMADVLRKKDARLGKHPIFLRCLGFKNWTMGEQFLLKCKHGALQYVVLKTLATIAVVVLDSVGLYEGATGWKNPGLYITIVMNFSVSWALYCLVKLFYATKEELRSPKNWHPAGKFLCVKGVVFFTFWQGIVIEILHRYGVIDAMLVLGPDTMAGFSGAYVAGCLQDYLVCIEMLFFAIAHPYTFTYKEYVTGNLQRGQCIWDDADEIAEPGGEGDEEGYDTYRTPVVRQLYAPMSFSHAFWSSTVPDETLKDIQRLGMGTSYARVERTNEVPFVAENAESI